jgi:hypothetical protein
MPLRLPRAAAGGLLVLGTTLTAQTLPVPALPPEPTPQPEATPSPQVSPPGPALAPAAVDAGPGRARPWEYAVGLSVDWDSNIDFLVPDGPSGVAVVPRGGLTRVFSGRSGALRATAAAGGIDYPDHKGPRRFYTDVGLEGSHRSSRNTEWHGSASYAFGYTDSSRILLEQGVSLPVVKARSLTAGLGLSSRVGRRTSLRVDARFYRTEFDSPGLIDGDSLRTALTLERSFSDRSTAAVAYSLENLRSGQAGRPYLTHFGSLQWTRVLSPRSGLLLEAGGSETPDALRAGLEQERNFFGGASFSRQVRRTGLTLFVRHEVTPAFGLGGSRLDVRSGIRATIPLGRTWELRLVATRVQPRTLRGGERLYGSDEVFAAVGRRMGTLQVTGEGRYRRRAAASRGGTIEAFHVGLAVTLLSRGGGGIAMTPAR